MIKSQSTELDQYNLNAIEIANIKTFIEIFLNKKFIKKTGGWSGGNLGDFKISSFFQF